jgi:hypothetical protein
MRFLDWFVPSRGVIALRPILMYYAVEIVSPLFLSGSFRVFLRMFPVMFSPYFQLFRVCFRPLFLPVLDMDLSSLFIVGEPSHRV